MQNATIKMFVILAVVFTMSSCEKDDDTSTLSEQKGSYTISMEGNTVYEGDDGEVGFVEGYSWAASMSKGDDISVLVSSVPTSGSTEIDGSDCVVTISGKYLLKTDGSDESYISVSGTVTRVSDTEIYFSGNCENLMEWNISSTLYSFEGTIESSAYKVMQ